MARFGWMCGAGLASIFGLACADAPERPAASPLAAELAGRVVVEGPTAGRRVVVSDLRDGVAGAAIVSTLTDEDGAWSLALGPVEGLVRVDVFVGVGGDQRLSAVVEGLSLGEKRSGIQVTSVTHLHSVLLEALRRMSGWDGALEKSKALLFGHFGGIDHRRVPAADLSAGPASAASGESLVALLLGGLDEQAERLRRSGAPEEGASTSTLDLIEAYARDLDDAVLDGRNRFGGPVTFAGHALTSFSLRTEYADALDAYTHRLAGRTGIDSAAIQSVLIGLRTSASELFPAAETLDSSDVTWVERKFLDDRGFDIPSGVPFRGSVDLHVVARSGLGLRDLRLEGESEASFAEDREPRAEELWSSLDTKGLEDGAHWVEVIAETAVSTFRTRLDFVTDNHPPEISLGELRGQRAEMTLRGSVSDTSFPVALIIAVAGAEQGRVMVGQAGEFSATITVPCGEPLPVSVAGVDLAGNQSEPIHLEAFCDEDAPSIVLEPSFFVPETEFVLEPNASGEGVDYRAKPGAMRMEISETATQPFSLAKYYNRLDADPQGQGANLPVFRIRASDGPGAPPPALAYRYLVDGIEERGWTALTADDTGRVTIPVSYQAMSTKLATNATAAHALEVRAIDQVGNETTKAWAFGIELLSPPVWISECRPTSFAWGQLPAVFQGAEPTVEFYSGTLAYPLDLPEASLAPPLDFQIDLGEGSATAEISAVRYVKFQDSLRETTWPRIEPMVAVCDAQRVDIYEDVYLFGSGVDELCLAGRAPGERVAAANRDWAPSQSTVLAATLQVGARDASALALDGDGHFQWPWGQRQLQLGIGVNDPHILLEDGTRYAWAGSYSDLFSPAANVTNRYWIPGLNVEGTEIPAPLRQGDPGYLMRAFRYVPTVAVVRMRVRVPSVAVTTPSLPLTVPLRWAAECTGGVGGVWEMEWRQ